MADSYPKILESDAGWELEPGELRRLGREPWVVTEKVHGANLSFAIEPERITLHKRKGPVARGESFFGAARVLARHEAGLHALAARARAELGAWFQGPLRGPSPSQQSCSGSPTGAIGVQLFGELYGGGYPHPDVASVADVQPIQTGVWYSPGIAFVAFDLALSDAEGVRFVDFDLLHELCLACEVPVAAQLARGTLSEALGYPLGFDSTLPAALGLPALSVPNQAEGVIVRPARETLVPTAKGPRRALLKRKLTSFSEDARFHLSQPWPDRRDGDPLVVAEREGLARINANRVQSAISKLGTVAEVGVTPVLAEVLRDVWEELFELGLLALLADEERELLRAVLSDSARSSVS